MQKFLNDKNLVRNTLVTVYVFIVLVFSATAKAQMTIMPILDKGHAQIQIQNYVGEVAMTVDGQFYLVINENQAYELKSNVDLAPFNGLMVSVDGYELKYKVKPVVELASLDPLPGNIDETTVAPLLVVFGISEISE